MQSTDLDGLIEKHPDCLTAAYADIGTGVTLLTPTGSTFPREALDELCGEAALTLGGDTPPLGAAAAPYALKVDHNAIYVYVRAPDDPGDALICMCRHTLSVENFVADARGLLAPPDQGNAP